MGRYFLPRTTILPVTVPATVVSPLVAEMVLLIQDIDRPGAGFVKVSQQPMVNAAAGLAAFPD